jgi:ABC-type glycerol-3-phosphate transport system substrate-binding protein
LAREVTVPRRRFLIGLGAFAFLPFLPACGSDAPAPPGIVRAHLRLTAYERAFFERVVLPAFERDRGLRVVWEEGNVEEAIDRLASPQSETSLIALDTERLGGVIAGQLLQPLDGERGALAAPPWQAMLPALESGGTLYALPYRPTTWITFYNRALLDAANLAPPATWDETLVAANRLRGAGDAGQVALQGVAGEPAARALTELILAYGGDPLAPTDAGSRAAGEFLARLGPRLSPLAREASFASMTRALGTGEVAIGPNWPSVAADLLQRGGQFQIAPAPAPAGPNGRARLLSGQVFAVPRHAANPAGGLAFAAYLRTPAMQATLARELAWLPAAEQALNAVPDWQREVATIAHAALRDARALPPLPRRDLFDNALGEAFRAIAFAGQSPATALRRARRPPRGVR